MQAVFLVGGKGTRLLSLTEGKIPKPMIEVNGRPFLLHLVNYLKKQGIHQFAFCIGHLGHIIEEFFGDGKKFGVSIVYSEETEPLGSAGAIKNAKHLLEENFLLLNGDDFFPIDHRLFFNFHRENDASITLAVRKKGGPNGFHTALLGEGNIIRKYYGAEHNDKSNVSFSGYFALNKRVLQIIPEGKFTSLEFDILPKVIKSKKCYGFLSEGELFDIGTPEGYYKLLQKEIQNKKTNMGRKTRASQR